MGIRDSETRYRVTRQRLLPRFGPAKNPFGAKANNSLGEPDKGATGGEATLLRREKPSAASHSLVPTVLVGSQRRQFTGMLWSRAAAIRKAWAGRLVALRSRSRGKAVAVAKSRSTRLPIQGELSLDHIKVVRNDLSDADLEVLPATTAAGRAGAGRVLRGAEGAGAGGRAWGRVSGFLRAGKT